MNIDLRLIFPKSKSIFMDKLFQSVKNGDIDAFERYISKTKPESFKKIINTPESSGVFLIHYAAKAGFLDICQRLVESGASINIVNLQRETPLHLAAENQYPDICQLFVDNGAIIDVKVYF